MTATAADSDWPEPKRIVGRLDQNGSTGCTSGSLDQGPETDITNGDEKEPRDLPAEGISIENRAMREKYPFLKLGQQPRVALSSEQAVRGLRRVMGEDGEVHGQGSKGYAASATIFNGAIQSAALAVVRPTGASHVSATIKFCKENGLDVSVKAGGSGVHGQCIAGNVIIDMARMNQISMTLPTDESSLEATFERLTLDQRPAFNSHSSSSSTIKRSADDAGVPEEEESMQSKRRDLDDIREDADSPSGSNNGNDSRSGSGSGSGSGSNSNSGQSTTDSRFTRSPVEENTPDTSVSSHDPTMTGSSRFGNTVDITRAVDYAFSHAPSRNGSSSSGASGSGSGSGSGSSNGVRISYVNPSPTAVGSFPFVATPHGSVGSYSSMPTSPYNTFPGFASGYNTLPQHSYDNTDAPPFTYVTFGAGVHSKELDRYTANSQYGPYAVPTSAFPVGAGQFLSGGFGFIGRKHGLAMDVLVEAEVVLADGRIVWVGENSASGEWKEGEDPRELWWGLRGAGAALGVVTRFRTKAFYVPTVFAGNFIFIFDHTTPSLLRHVRDCIKSSPRTLYNNIILTAGPPGAPAIVVIQLCYSGPRAEGEKYVQAIASWEGGRCLFQDFSERSYEMQQTAVEEVLKGGFGKKWYIKSDMIKSLSDHIIDETCARFGNIPDGCTWLFEFTGGGVSGEVTDSCYPQDHRQSTFTVAALHQWSQDEPPALDTRCVITAEQWISEVIGPNSVGGPLPCFLQSAQEADVRAVYGSSYDRLLQLKRIIDPTDLFKHAMFVRADGSGGPDEWKQLPPMTEDRVRALNAERAAQAPMAYGGSGGSGPSGNSDDEGGGSGNGSGGKVISPPRPHRADESGLGGTGVNGNMDVDIAPDGNGNDNTSAPLDSALNGQNNTSTSDNNTHNDNNRSGVPRSPSEAELVTVREAAATISGTTSGLVNGPIEVRARHESVVQRTENVPEEERSAAGVVDPVTNGESQVM